MEKLMYSKPIIHVHYINDDYKEWNGPPHFEKYLQAERGRIFESCGGFDPLDILSVSPDEIVIRLDEQTKTLRLGETVTMRYVLPGLIADGSGFEYFTLTARWLTEEEAKRVIAEPINLSH